MTNPFAHIPKDLAKLQQGINYVPTEPVKQKAKRFVYKGR